MIYFFAACNNLGKFNFNQNLNIKNLIIYKFTWSKYSTRGRSRKIKIKENNDIKKQTKLIETKTKVKKKLNEIK